MLEKNDFSRRFVLFLLLISLAITILSTFPVWSKLPVWSKVVWSKALPVAIKQWNATAALPEGLASRNAVTHGDFVYVVGGKKTDENPSATIYGARLQLAGGVENWAVVGQLPMPLYLHAAVVAGDALFVIGGWDGKMTRTEVWRAPFLPDGRVGGWTPMPAYPVGLDLHDAALLNGRIYVVGGWDGTQAQQGVYAATIAGNALGAWQRVGDLPQPLYRLAIAADGQRLYVTGGYGATESASAAAYVTTINSNGLLSGWQSYTMPVALYYHKAVIHDGQLVVLGGRDNTQTFNQVYTAPINANGVLGGWQNAPALPAAIYRFGAVTVNRFGASYIFVAGGALSESAYQTAVYHSDAPLPPTATPTPTVLPTATPTPSVRLSIQSEPRHWIAPGEEIAYVITYQNPSTTALNDAVINNRIPNAVELVPNSILSAQGISSTSGSAPGDLIAWQLGTVGSGATGQVSYRVRRPFPPTPVVPPALTIDLVAPPTANRGGQVTYDFTLSNHSPTALSSLVLTNTLPLDALYISGGDGAPTNQVVRWSIPTLAADSSITVQLVVNAQQSLVNSDYRVTTKEGPTARGRAVVVTLVDGQPPVHGDGVTIKNEGARITWTSQGQSATLESRTVYNPSFNLYLPLTRR